MKIILRPIQAPDIEPATQCGVAAWLSSIAPLLEDFHPSNLSNIEQTFHYFFLAHLMETNRRDDQLIVADEGGDVIGFYHLDVVAGILTDLWVPQQWQGQGIGALMMKDAIATTRQSGHQCLQLEVQEGNARAIAFYRKYGFVEFGTKNQHDPILGYKVKKIQMKLSLKN